jgi:non-ribosomal peptide synthetase component F
MAVAALGILRAGAACVPVDPACPSKRLAFLLAEVKAPFLLTTRATLPGNGAVGGCRIVTLEEAERLDIPDYPPKAFISAGDCAFIVGDSTSAERSPSVRIAHGALSNLVLQYRHGFGVTVEDRACQVAGSHVAVWELCVYPAAGASVHLADDRARSGPELLRNWLRRYRITVGFVPPPLATRLASLMWPRRTPLRLLLTGDAPALQNRSRRDLPFRLVAGFSPLEWTKAELADCL